jgi:lipid-A-disaccharide synthase
MRIFISTGEVSGDLQGSLLITALKARAIATGVELEIVALGGDKMAAAGATLLGNTTAISSFGTIESLPFIIPTLKMQRLAKKYLQQNPPDVVVLVDYAGPNMAIGSYVKRFCPQVPVVYYIAPQMWVWWPFPGQIDQVVKMTDELLAIFPEEARYFQSLGVKTTWVGHPLVDRMQNPPSREVAREQLGILPEQIAIALFPASRPQEIKYLLPTIFQVAKTLQEKLPTVHFWIPLSLELYRQQITQAIEAYGLQATISDQQKVVMAAADLAIAKSGTVNLELALLNVPQVVLYKLSPITAWIGQTLLKSSIAFASPVNLVVMREIVPEFIQKRATPENITVAALDILLNDSTKAQMLTDYQEMRSSLGEVGVCDRAAASIFRLLE